MRNLLARTVSYYRARYYDPAVGRFLSEDPAWKGINWYSYVANDPAIGTDPSGLETLPKDPSGLPPWWRPDLNHKDPQSQRFCRPNGDCLDFTKGKPGAHGWEGQDHWHWNPYDPEKKKCVKDKKIGKHGHLEPGDEIPDDPNMLNAPEGFYCVNATCGIVAPVNPSATPNGTPTVFPFPINPVIPGIPGFGTIPIFNPVPVPI